MHRLEERGGVETEIVRLSDYRFEPCRGCKVCFSRGEEFCPLKDDRDVLVDKIKVSDGVVFASPKYSFQVSAFMKLFLDRLGYAFHRPQFHGKTFTSIRSGNLWRPEARELPRLRREGLGVQGGERELFDCLRTYDPQGAREEG